MQNRVLHNAANMNGVRTVNSEYLQPNSKIHNEPISNRYTVHNEIGRGKFAVVRRCTHNESGKVVAAKFIRKRRKGRCCRQEILREVVMLELALVHPHLVDLIEVFETPQEIVLVTEYCSGGELFHECVIEESFKELDVVRFLRQILEGIVFLHERNIVHLDLKPQNILLTDPFPDGTIKLCDFGFACLISSGEDLREILGTPDYVAPEVLNYEPLSLATDIWSLGVLTYVMLTAHSPFVGENQQETFLNITLAKLDFPESLFAHISAAAHDFIQSVLIKNPKKRPTAKQCLDHPWLQGCMPPPLPVNLPELGASSESENNKTNTMPIVEDDDSSYHDLENDDASTDTNIVTMRSSDDEYHECSSDTLWETSLDVKDLDTSAETKIELSDISTTASEASKNISVFDGESESTEDECIPNKKHKCNSLPRRSNVSLDSVGESPSKDSSGLNMSIDGDISKSDLSSEYCCINNNCYHGENSSILSESSLMNHSKSHDLDKENIVPVLMNGHTSHDDPLICSSPVINAKQLSQKDTSSVENLKISGLSNIRADSPGLAVALNTGLTPII